MPINGTGSGCAGRVWTEVLLPAGRLMLQRASFRSADPLCIAI